MAQVDASIFRSIINIRLADVHPLEPGTESMGRSWYGYDQDCTDTEFWAKNRGRYVFTEGRVEQERFATMSYRGEIVVVASPHAIGRGAPPCGLRGQRLAGLEDSVREDLWRPAVVTRVVRPPLTIDVRSRRLSTHALSAHLNPLADLRLLTIDGPGDGAHR